MPARYPGNSYNDVWRTYQHHVEIFYDFLHLNRELRDLDFKFNLEEKQKPHRTGPKPWRKNRT